jgi:hypothetical protein
LVGERVVLRAVRPDAVADIVGISVNDGVTAADNAASIGLLERLGFAPRPSDDAFLTLALGVDRDTKGTGSRG